MISLQCLSPSLCRIHYKTSLRPICEGMGLLKQGCKFLFLLHYNSYKASCHIQTIFNTSIPLNSILFACTVYMVKNKPIFFPLSKFTEPNSLDSMNTIMIEFFRITWSPQSCTGTHYLCKIFRNLQQENPSKLTDKENVFSLNENPRYEQEVLSFADSPDITLSITHKEQ